jgi:outer membrane protein assembly factor BamB
MGSGDSLLLAIRPDGRGDVTDTHVAWRYTRAVPKRASLLLVGDLLFMVSDDGVAACVEARTGREVWRKRLGGNYSSSPIHANGLVYFFDQDGKSTVIKASRDYTVIAENHLDDGFMASPAVSGDSLFLRTRSHLYRIDALAGS